MVELGNKRLKYTYRLSCYAIHAYLSQLVSLMCWVLADKIDQLSAYVKYYSQNLSNRSIKSKIQVNGK